MDPDESLTHKKLADQLEKWGDIGRRSPHLPADGETYLVEEAPDFIQRLAELEVKRLPDIAILPRNFYTAPSAEAFVFERETNDVRVIARQAGTVAEPLSESASILHENDAVTIGVVIAISVQLLGAVNSSATLIEFFQRLGGFLARKVSRVSDPSVEIVQEVILTHAGTAKRLTYRGPANQLHTVVDALNRQASELVDPDINIEP